MWVGGRNSGARATVLTRCRIARISLTHATSRRTLRPRCLVSRERVGALAVLGAGGRVRSAAVAVRIDEAARVLADAADGGPKTRASARPVRYES